ncbi:hypothetical protein B5C34_03195 [Pacificimonas flava]|uniref:DUF2125 domain-containing protein n=2 Tax=Pacificimonas TaxID=1960290 RepID=A0A219B2H7_9SPHN|nr:MULTISPECIES: hypothetical protein [Pacificimonas]MBZ6377775.1 hypothetical protein [Pacificimonas aurantium]OWV32550.1 hypothetical protein B5C34_03195 [Pacificimonas flava]
MKSWQRICLALLPLTLGLGGYWLYWRAQANDFAQLVESVAGERPALSGFPYSLRAELPGLALARGDDARIRVAGSRAEVSTGPFRSAVSVTAVESAEVEAALTGFPDARMTLSAPLALASLRAGPVIERLSVVAEKARAATPLLGQVGVTDLEFHFRETPTAAPAAGPTGPGQAEARLSGLFRFGDDVALRLLLPVTIAADAPLSSLRGWQDGGTIEIDGGLLTGADEAPLAGFDATAAPLPGGSIALSGTFTTDCPLTLRWLVGGDARPAEEFRRRNPAQFSLSGTLREPVLTERPTPSGGLARSREPPCPDLRR